jgi:hypothetical protein
VTPESPLATVLRLLTGTTAGPGGCMLWAGAVDGGGGDDGEGM